MATMKDIASLAQVSVATVSFVINNTRYVSEEKRQRVLKAIEELNYIPNVVARGLKVNVTKTLALILTDISNPFYPELAKGCEDFAIENGYVLSIFNSNWNKNDLKDCLKIIAERKFDGVIIASATLDDEAEIKKLIKSGISVVLTHRKIPGFKIDSVISNNEDGIKQAINHLVEVGCKTFAFFEGKDNSYVNQVSKQVFIDELIAKNIHDYKIIKTRNDYESGYFEAEEYFNSFTNPKDIGIICIDDNVALGVLDAAEVKDIKVPDDISIVGIGDYFFSKSKRVQLSSIRIDKYHLGYEATKLLVRKMEKEKDTNTEKVESHTEIVLDTTLIVRESSKKINSEFTKYIDN